MKDENTFVEYKKSLAQLKEGVISLSSMLNKEHRCELFFGVGPDHRVYKHDISKKSLSDVSNEIRTNLKPLPTTLEIGIAKIEGIDVIRVYAEGEDTPYSAYGRYYSRVDEGDIPMTNSQLQKYFEEKEDSYSRWEEKPTSYSYDDIDEELLIGAIRNAHQNGRLSYVYRDVKEALVKLGLVDNEGRIKTAGYYLFGKNKPLTIKEATYPTDSRTEFGELKEFQGNIFECIQEAISYIQNHISYKSEIIGVQRIEKPEIPIKAIREIVINAFAHANYSMRGDYIQIVLHKSSLRIYNPGSIYKNIDPMRFARAEVGSKIRNILIASVLYKCGYIDAFGTGFDRTFTLCGQNGIGYEYHNDEFGFTFAFRRDPHFISDKKKDETPDKTSPLDKIIVFVIRKDKYVTIPEMAERVGKSEPTVYRHLEQLVKKGIVRRVASRKSGYWEVVDNE